MLWFSKKNQPTRLKDVWGQLRGFYKLPAHQDFVFLNARTNALRENRKAGVLAFAMSDNPLPYEPQTYARMCEIVLKRYRDTIPELSDVRVWDRIRKDYVAGQTQLPR